MNIFDPAKDQINRVKHGISLTEADDFEWENAFSWSDTRFAYGEERMIAIGYIGNRLYVMVYVDRVMFRRIISLRKANSREVKHYAQA